MAAIGPSRRRLIERQELDFLFTSSASADDPVDGMTPRRTVPWNGDQRRPCATGTRVQTRACCDGGWRTSDSSGGIRTHVSIMGRAGGEVGDPPLEPPLLAPRPTCNHTFRVFVYKCVEEEIF